MNQNPTITPYVPAKGSEQPAFKSVLTLESAAETMRKAKSTPVPFRIAGPLLVEGEHTLLFSDTNLGKTILATQIAVAASTGDSFSSQFQNESAPHKVLYLDFELGCQQFAPRYAEVDGRTLVNEFEFPQNFVRAEIDPQKIPPGELGQIVLDSIKAEVETKGFKTVIVDNITWLSDDTEKGDAAGVLMKEFHRLVRDLKITILTLAHTPKVPTHVPVTLNHLAGSKKLSNFADAVFAIGRDWRNPDTHVYLRQLKARGAGAQRYGAENVVVMERTKPSNFLGFEFRHYASEDDICRKESDRDREARHAEEEEKVQAVLKGNPGASLREIGEITGLGHPQKVKRAKDRIEERVTPAVTM